MVLVLAGTALVGLDSILTPDTSTSADKPSNPNLGNALIVVAQFVVAIQMVVEERFVSGKKVQAISTP